MARSERTLIRLAWSTWAASLALLATGVGMLLVVRYRYPGVPAYGYWRESTIIPGVYGTLGLVIATRRPQHPVGWLLIGLGLAGSLQLVAGQYAILAGPAGLPGRLHAMWTANQFQITWVGLVLLLLLLFPTGRLPSPHWRLVAWSVVAGTGLALVTRALDPKTLSDTPGYRNPFALPALEPVLGLLEVLGGALVFVGLFGALASLGVRLRRSRGRERQQLKWFVYVALLGIAAIYLLDPSWRSSLGSRRAAAPVESWRSSIRGCWPRLPSRSRSRSRSSATGCTTSIGCSTAPWSGGSSRCYWGRCTRPECSCLAGSSTRPTASLNWPWPPPLWPWRPCSSRPGGGCRPPWTVGSTGPAMTRPGPWRPSVSDCGTKSISTRSRPSC
jgi:hypothetical protein